jgi:uncharacterized membrane protein YdjX (TVP38/TMEM64 family)
MTAPDRRDPHPAATPGAPATSTKTWLRIAVAALFVAAIVAFFVAGGLDQFSVEALKRNRQQLLALTRDHYAAALVIAFAVYTTATALSIPTGALLSLTLGLLFGRWVASALVVAGATLGATLLFLGVRYLFADTVRRRLGRLGERINEDFTRDGFSWLLFMRLSPIFPYFLVNLAPAVTDIRARTYVLATMIGIIPSTLVFTGLGQTLGRIESARDLVSIETLLALTLLGLLALSPIALRRRKSKRR